MNNKSEFYTKLFTKIIGRETEADNSDGVEAYLKILDAEADDVTPTGSPPQLRALVAENLIPAKLAQAAKLYTYGEPVD